MTCLTCSHGALRDSADAERDKYLRRMAALGFVNCTRSQMRATFHGAAHRCKHWAEADEKKTAARVAWRERAYERR